MTKTKWSIWYSMQFCLLALIGVIGVYANAYFNRQDTHQLQLNERGIFMQDVSEYIEKASQSRWSREQQIEFWQGVKTRNPKINVPNFPPEIPPIKIKIPK